MRERERERERDESSFRIYGLLVDRTNDPPFKGSPVQRSTRSRDLLAAIAMKFSSSKLIFRV